jgi:putative transposase
LNETLFRSLARVRATLEACRRDYNETRPHSKLGWITPGAYAGDVRGRAAQSLLPAGRRVVALSADPKKAFAGDSP